MEVEEPPSPWPGITYAERMDGMSSFEKKVKLRQSQQTKEELSKLFNLYTEKSISLVKANVPHSTPEEMKINQPCVNFCLKKVKKLEQTLQSIHETYYSGVATQVSRIICFFTECEAKGFIPVCDVEKLNNHVTDMSFKSRSVKQVFQKLNYFIAFINSHIFVPRLPEVPLYHLQPLIADVAQYSDLTYRYTKPNLFDTFYADFIVTSGKKQMFLDALGRILSCPENVSSSHPRSRRNVHIISDDIEHDRSTPEHVPNQSDTESEKSKPRRKNSENTQICDVVDMKFFHNFINQQIDFFELTKKEEKIVVECAVTRMIFDLYYIKYPTFLIPFTKESELDEKYHKTDLKILKNCMRIREMSPKQLQAREDLFPPDQYVIPFTEICQQSIHIKESVKHISTLSFYVNPLDIVAASFHALKSVENYVLSQSKTTDASNMSFDDFFGLFFPVFAIDPPPNCSILLEFIDMFGKMNYSMPFQFAYAILTSTISFIRDFDESKLSSDK